MTIYALQWNGDEDCGGRNDGIIAIFEDKNYAEQQAQRLAEQEAMKYAIPSSDVNWVMQDNQKVWPIGGRRTQLEIIAMGQSQWDGGFWRIR